MVFFFTGLHHRFFGDLFGISLDVYQYIHYSTGLMLFFLTLFHILISYSLLAKAYWFELIVNTDRRWYLMLTVKGENIAMSACNFFFIFFTIRSFMKSFSTHIKLWLRFFSILLDVICYQIDFFLTSIYISSLACFWQCYYLRLVVFCIRITLSVMVAYRLYLYLTQGQT